MAQNIIFSSSIFDQNLDFWQFSPTVSKIEFGFRVGLKLNFNLYSTQSGHKNWSETSLVIDEKTKFDVGTWETRNENDCD